MRGDTVGRAIAFIAILLVVLAVAFIVIPILVREVLGLYERGRKEE